MNQSFFIRTFFRSALAILEPQIYIVVQRVGAENISLLSGRLVYFNLSIKKQHTFYAQLRSKTSTCEAKSLKKTKKT